MILLFEVFDSSKTIQKITIAEETVNQTTGEIVPASEGTPENILGHLSDITQKELAYLDAALVEHGVRKFATSENIFVGDILRITELDSSTEDWNVEKLMYENSLISRYIGESRKTYLLKKI